MKKVLVTGGAGFVGVHTIDALLKRGYRVRVLDNFSCSSRAGFRPYIRKTELVEGDIRDAAKVRRAVRGMDAVFHLAAIRSVAKTVEDPFLSHEVNAGGALTLLDAACRARVKHFLFTSTSAVYGAACSGPQKEEGRLDPISPYGIAKLAAERYGNYYFRERRLPVTAVRIFNVYGPRQNPESRYSLVIPGILSRILRGQRPVIDGSGEQARDFVHIADVVGAFFKILGSLKAHGRVYNLGAGGAYSINTIAKKLLALCGSGLSPVHGPKRPGDPDKTCADISRIRRELGWAPKITLEKGLRETVAWAKKEF